MKAELEAIAKQALEELKGAQDLKVLDAVRVKYLGKKGELTAILKQMGKLSAEDGRSSASWQTRSALTLSRCWSRPRPTWRQKRWISAWPVRRWTSPCRVRKGRWAKAPADHCAGRAQRDRCRHGI